MVRWTIFLPALVIVIVAGTITAASALQKKRQSEAVLTSRLATPTPAASSSPVASKSANHALIDAATDALLGETEVELPAEQQDESVVAADEQSLQEIENTLKSQEDAL